jgi:hemerythrin-like domain-containing protein
MLTSSAPGFDDPLALLRACHERILRQCETLSKVTERLPADGLTPDLREAAAAVHRYFTTTGRHHHEDEELDLFPLLRGDSVLAPLLDWLQTDHRRLEQLWRKLEPYLAAPESITDPAAFAARVREFNGAYAAHIMRENQELLPRAAALLPPAILTVLGARMAARRGVSPLNTLSESAELQDDRGARP